MDHRISPDAAPTESTISRAEPPTFVSEQQEPTNLEYSSEFVSISWNIEGFQSNVNNLVHFVNLHSPSFIFLSEPQTFQHDLTLASKPLQLSYSSFLNSSDLHDPDLGMSSSRTHGGTLVLWRKEYDPYVKIQSPKSTSFLILEFSPPGLPPSAHVCVYLPTAGKESLFIDNLAQLTLALENIKENNPETLCYLRGDFNVSNKNERRLGLFQQFCSDSELKAVEILHKTYHHFMGSGESDSHLDRLLYSEHSRFPETLREIHCKLENPLVNSHHDLIVSSFTLPHVPILPEETTNLTAPVVKNSRVRIKWSELGITQYKMVASKQLDRAWDMWSNPKSRSSLSVLIQTTSSILNQAACLTNEKIDLDAAPLKPQAPKVPRNVRRSQKTLLKKHKQFQAATKTASVDETLNLKKNYSKIKSEHGKLEQKFSLK